MLLTLACTGLFGLAEVGCSDGGNPDDPCAGGDFSNCKIPRIDTQPAVENIELSESNPLTTIRVINTGFKTLTLKSAFIDYTKPEGGTDGAKPAFELQALPVELPTNIEIYNSLDFPQGVDLKVAYNKPVDDIPRTADLVLVSSDPIDPEIRVSLTSVTGAPALSATPNPVDFGLVQKSTTRYPKDVTILNQGNRILNVGGFRIANDARFGVKGDGFEIEGPDALLGVSLPKAIQVPPGESKKVTVTFLSDSPSPATGELVIYSDDPHSGTSGYVVNLVANKNGPCIAVDPDKIEFGGKLVGSSSTITFKIKSCGTEPLSVRDLAFLSGSSPDFAFDYSQLPNAAAPTAAQPLVIPVAGQAIVGVTFVPDTVNPRDADNIPIPDEATIGITSNAYIETVEVPVAGAGSDVECPTPVIVVQEGEEVIPQTVIHLDARQSYAPFGGIRSYLWTIKDWPDGTPKPTMIPNFSDPQPVVELNIVGTYTFGLGVIDDQSHASGTAACPDAEYTVLVQPDQAIHVELTWHTPGDADETDSGEGLGSDLDLHFAHQFAMGPDIDGDGVKDPWFDKNWDVFWFNRNPPWGTFSPDGNDDPSLDRDDTDGVGPENLNLKVPEDGVTYRIGVHYWNALSYGPSDATVKVYHYADLVYESTYVGLQELDMWCVGEIHWPTVGVQRCAAEGDPEKVAPNYVNPFFRPPLFN